MWHQGEADAQRQDAADAYEGRLAALLDHLRTDIDDAELPIVAGELGARFLGDAFPHAAAVNDAIRRVAGAPHTAWVGAPSGCHSDRLHFDANGMEDAGSRAADEWHRMWKRRCCGERRVGPHREPLTKDEWRRKYGGLAAPGVGGKAWAAAPTWRGGGGVHPQPPGGGAAGTAAAAQLQRGDAVEAFGLQGVRELNGAGGVIVELRNDGRTVVAFAAHGEKALRRENLRRTAPAAAARAAAAAAGAAAPAAAACSAATDPFAGCAGPADSGGGAGECDRERDRRRRRRRSDAADAGAGAAASRRRRRREDGSADGGGGAERQRRRRGCSPAPRPTRPTSPSPRPRDATSPAR